MFAWVWIFLSLHTLKQSFVFAEPQDFGDGFEGLVIINRDYKAFMHYESLNHTECVWTYLYLYIKYLLIYKNI